MLSVQSSKIRTIKGKTFFMDICLVSNLLEGALITSGEQTY